MEGHAPSWPVVVQVRWHTNPEARNADATERVPPTMVGLGPSWPLGLSHRPQRGLPVSYDCGV